MVIGGAIIVNGTNFFMTKHPKKIYCEVHDALYDLETGEWLEDGCNNPKCHYCGKRPPKHKKNCKC